MKMLTRLFPYKKSDGISFDQSKTNREASTSIGKRHPQDKIKINLSINQFFLGLLLLDNNIPDEILEYITYKPILIVDSLKAQNE